MLFCRAMKHCQQIVNKHPQVRYMICLAWFALSPSIALAQTDTAAAANHPASGPTFARRVAQADTPVELTAPSGEYFENEIATQADINQQNQRILQLEQQLNQLQTGTAPGLEAGRLRSSDVPKVEDLQDTPAFPKVKLTGFFHVDGGFFSQDDASEARFGDIDDIRGFRRARLAAVGDVAENVSYVLEMDFAAPGRPSFMDVWGDVHDVPLFGNVRVGQYRMPFGMDALTSVRELTFLERALPFALNPFRQIGAGFHDNNEAETITWAGSVFGFPTDPWGTSSGDEGYGLAGRVTGLPIFEAEGAFLLHVGFGYALTRPSTETVRYRSQPEFGGPFIGSAGNLASVPFFADTGVLNADSSDLLNVELAAVWNQLYVQSELTYALVDLTNGDSATFPGFYAHAGYFLTGEQRTYNKIGGVLGRVKPLRNLGDAGGHGAWEVAARYSYLNLNDGPTDGGRLNDVTLGLNWYLNQYTKVQFNYIRAMADQAAFADSDTDMVAMRAQLDF